MVVLILVCSFAGYEIGFNQKGQPITSATTVTQYETAASTTITATQYQTNIVSENASLSNLMMSNLTFGGFPDSIGINSRTNLVYVEYSFNTTNLAVINGSTNTLITSIPLGKATQATPIINPDTNAVYIGNAIINGTSNKVSQYFNQSMTFVGFNPNLNEVYAMNITSSGHNGTTTIYALNGENNNIVDSVSFAGVPEAGDNPIAMNEQTGILYLSVCTNECGFLEQYIVGVGATSSGLRVVSQIPINKLVFNIAANPATNMIYVTAVQNLLIAINGTTNQVVDEIPITAYANELRGISVDPLSNEIFLAGSPDCQGFSGCGVNSLYVISGANYGTFATFVSSSPFILQFDSANNQTYVLYYFSSFVASVKIPQYVPTILLP